MSAEKEKKKKVEEMSEEVYRKAVAAVRDSLPKIGVNIGIAVLIWIFANIVFIPISRGYFIAQYSVTALITTVTIVAMAVLILGILKEIRDVADAAAGFAAVRIGRTVTVEEVEHYKTAFRSIFYVVVVSLGFLLFAENLKLLHPAISAIVLIAVVIWAIFQLYRAGKAVHSEIERWAKEAAKAIEKAVK